MRRGIGAVHAVASVLVLSGCDVLLGLDDFSDASGAGGSVAASSATQGGGGASATTTSAGGTGGTDAAGGSGGSAPLKRVFLTSDDFKGGLEGLSGGDDKCTDEAEGAGLGGMWTAWLSTVATPAVGRLPRSGGPWHLVNTDGAADPTELVAANRDALVNDGPQREINRFPDGTSSGSADRRVWTGTGSNGMSATPDCEDWVANSGEEGRYGNANKKVAGWTDNGTQTCDLRARLYCFEM